MLMISCKAEFGTLRPNCSEHNFKNSALLFLLNCDDKSGKFSNKCSTCSLTFSGGVYGS